jgi:diguanylate cyclase
MAQAPTPADRSRSIALQAFKKMQDLGITPTPENYATWYAFFAGSNPDLCAEIQRLDDSGALGPEDTSRLHEAFLGTGRERRGLAAVSAQIESAMRVLMENVGEVEQGAQNYGKALSTLSGELSSHGQDELGTLVTMVLGETNRMADLNRHLEERLSQSAKEINRLRQDLEVVRVEATTDALTGLANRKAFDSALRNAAIEAGEKGGFLCALMLDIDFFKKFNDTHGHQTGDQVLKLVAKTMQTVVPDGCLPARLGGEEFCVLVPQLGLQQAKQIGETIRKAVGSKTLRNRKTGADLGAITLSCGVSEYVLGEALTTFLERADEALYLATRQGRNQVCTQIDLDREAASNA